jgi:hypothetical protein
MCSAPGWRRSRTRWSDSDSAVERQQLDRIGVALYPGMSELDLSNVYDTHAATTVAELEGIALDAGPVVTAHGLTLLPSRTAADVARLGLDRLMVTGVEARVVAAPLLERVAAVSPALQRTYLHADAPARFGLEPVLEDLARTADVATAHFALRRLEYRSDSIRLEGSAVPWRTLGFPFLRCQAVAPARAAASRSREMAYSLHVDGARLGCALVQARALAAACALAACGRVAFQPAAGPEDDESPGETITVIVTSDEYLAEPAGQPIRGATVLIERDGAVERTATDGAGTARFAAAGVSVYHVVYKADLGWRIYTAAAPRAGTFEYGGRSAFNLSQQMTLSIPGGAAADSFALTLPDRCATVLPSPSPSFTFDYNAVCSGEAVRVIAFRLPPSAPEYLDAGLVTLANGATRVVTGTYQTALLRTIEITDLPAGTASVFADVVVRSADDVVRLTPVSSPVTTGGMPTAAVSTFAAPGGDALHVRAFLELPGRSSSSSERIAPAMIAGTTQFDATSMLPLFTQVTADGLVSVSWTGGGTGGTVLAVEAVAGMLQWDAYTQPSATSVTFPSLPADLGVPRPASFAVVTVAKLDIPGATADTARTLDRTWQLWPNSVDLVSPSGGSMTRALYLPGP